MEDKEIRLEIVKTVVPQASKVSLVNSETIVKTCSQLEEYVLGSKCGKSVPQTKQKGRQPKRTTGKASTSASDPTHGG